MTTEEYRIGCGRALIFLKSRAAAAKKLALDAVAQNNLRIAQRFLAVAIDAESRVCIVQHNEYLARVYNEIPPTN